MRGIAFNGRHSWYDFHAVISKSEKSVPEKKLVEETVPYSNMTYDFSCMNGEQTYQDRILKYTFTLLPSAHIRQKADDFIRWLYEPAEKIILKDDSETEYHYLAKCTSISTPEFIGNICILTAVFTAYPLRIPDRPSVIFTEETAPYPDVNQDGTVNAEDAALILTAAANIGSGQPSGLTEEQEYLADADGDGDITASDASLVITFASACGAGKYEDSPAGWVKFRNDRLAQSEEVL